MISKIKQAALNAVETEAASVAGLSAFIDDAFEKVVNTIAECKGRIIISGIGKSAIVGQKIVATFNSTGTPSIFMHAADAIHGDLGMMQKDDVVILISKSGESPEIKVLIPLIKTAGNILIGMVGNIDSYLAKESDLILNTTVEKEACPNNLAPTSSTTAQMVMGDAVAVSLMELNGFGNKDFAKFHPGGNLGKRLYLRVSDLYKLNAQPKVFVSTPLRDVIIEISKARLGAAVVVNDTNDILGIITDGDVRRLLEKTENLGNIIASDILSKNPKTVEAEKLASEALEILRANDITQVVVVDENKKYCGIIHLHDLLREGII